VDGTKYEGCSSQSGWGKMCAKSFTGSAREGSACPGDSGSPLVIKFEPFHQRLSELRPENWFIGLNGDEGC
jgi:hypothetical protein